MKEKWKRKSLIFGLVLSLAFTFCNIDTKINPGNTVVAAKSAVTISTKNKVKYVNYKGKAYKIVKVYGGDKSGDRLSNTAVDVGYGKRVYWALTNKYGQLTNVIADKVILQDDYTEAVTSQGRYYYDEAKVPGVEQYDLDEGHVIADSLGGVSNAYNITPQNSTLNRHGDQAYMEKNIRDAGGCTSFKATIKYKNTKTQIPSHYHYTYTLKGNNITEDFDNVNSDKAASNVVKNEDNNKNNTQNKISDIDTNGNGRVTIPEAKAAGFKMPITRNHWLYKYMDDRDGDGFVGE